METSISYCGGGRMFFSSDERRWITRIRKLAAENPQDVRIIQQPERNDGCIYAELSYDMLRIQPKIHRQLTDEQRATLTERLKIMRENRTSYAETETVGIAGGLDDLDEQDEQQGGA